MLNRSLKNWALCATLAAATGAVWAQTSTAPGTVGVTPENAREATQKAVPREDTGSLVRTDPSAAARAEEAARNAQNALTPDNRITTSPSAGTNATRNGNAMPNTAGSTNNVGTTGTGMGTGADVNQSGTSLNANNSAINGNSNNRLARADRN